MPAIQQQVKSQPLTPLRLDSRTTLKQNVVDLRNVRVHTPSSSVPTTPVVSARSASPAKRTYYTGQPNSFLTELAAQERRVLELKEELQKAEVELDMLKKQWANHEATKKRNESHHVEQLQTLTTFNERGEYPSEDQASIELDPEKQLMGPPLYKPSQRTVFSGSRHTRALSLLLPKDSEIDHKTPLRDNRMVRARREAKIDHPRPSIIEELGLSTDGANESDIISKGPPTDMLLETGKQLVGDFRNGLWTFFEDLKQVTVGDEAATANARHSPAVLPAEQFSKGQLRRDKTFDGKHRSTSRTDNLQALNEGKERPRKKSGTSPTLKEGTEPDSVLRHPSLEERNPSSSTGITYSNSDDEAWDDWHATASHDSTPGKDRGFSPMTDTRSSRTSGR